MARPRGAVDRASGRGRARVGARWTARRDAVERVRRRGKARVEARWTARRDAVKRAPGRGLPRGVGGMIGGEASASMSVSEFLSLLTLRSEISKAGSQRVKEEAGEAGGRVTALRQGVGGVSRWT